MKIFLASAENMLDFQYTLSLLPKPNLLVSYYYLRRKIKDPAKMHDWLAEARRVSGKLFLDSGAHTFIVANNLKKYAQAPTKGTTEDPVTYYKEFRDWVKDYSQYFDFIAELDVAECLEDDPKKPTGKGYKIIQGWRDELCAMGLKEKLLVVSHFRYFKNIFPNWWEEWERLCDEWPCLAIGDDPPESILNKHFSVWFKKGKKNTIHGFAETKIWKMLKYPFYSVDSSSWHIGQRFGTFIMYEPQPMPKLPTWQIDRKNPKKSYDQYLVKVVPNLEPDARKYPIDLLWDYTKGGYGRCHQNALAFMRLEKDLTKIWAQRGITFPD